MDIYIDLIYILWMIVKKLILIRYPLIEIRLIEGKVKLKDLWRIKIFNLFQLIE